MDTGSDIRRMPSCVLCITCVNAVAGGDVMRVRCGAAAMPDRFHCDSYVRNFSTLGLLARHAPPNHSGNGN